MSSNSPTQTIQCPKCHKDLDIESIREHRDGRKRIYWECNDCKLSIMDRG
ncbi:MAG TPA: hypothetical protein VJG90_01905 [Candidatus Nanoarchaeia archaeon]|nr:hypothetical protein [Candidatus Nanoarchaeia archaeon]